MIAGIAQRLVHGHQRQQLQRVDGRQRVGRNAVAHGIERHGVQEAAPTGVDLILGFAVWIVVQVDVEALLGNVADGIDLVQDIGPESAHVGRLRKQAAHAYDGDIERLERRRSLHARAGKGHGQFADQTGAFIRDIGAGQNSDARAFFRQRRGQHRCHGSGTAVRDARERYVLRSSGEQCLNGGIVQTFDGARIGIGLGHRLQPRMFLRLMRHVRGSRRASRVPWPAACGSVAPAPSRKRPAASSTTPAAPLAYQPAAECRPMPPAPHTGIGEASGVLATTPSKPKSPARAASSAVETSNSTRRDCARASLQQFLGPLAASWRRRSRIRLRMPAPAGRRPA